MNTLSLDSINAYDPMGGSYAFSPVGYSGSYAGFGDTEAARANTALKYRLDIQNFRVGGLVQVGGYNWGNGTDGIYQAQAGGDFKFPSGGVLSIDGTASFAKDAVNIGTLGSAHSVRHRSPRAPSRGETACSHGSGLPAYPEGLQQTRTSRRRCRITSASCSTPSTSGRPGRSMPLTNTSGSRIPATVSERVRDH